MAQMSLFDTVQDDDIIKELSELDISNMTPIGCFKYPVPFPGKGEKPLEIGEYWIRT